MAVVTTSELGERRPGEAAGVETGVVTAVGGTAWDRVLRPAAGERLGDLPRPPKAGRGEEGGEMA